MFSPFDISSILMYTVLNIQQCLIQCDNKINQVFLILTTRKLSMNRNDLRAPSLPPQWDHPGYTKDLDPQLYYTLTTNYISKLLPRVCNSWGEIRNPCKKLPKKYIQLRKKVFKFSQAPAVVAEWTKALPQIQERQTEGSRLVILPFLGHSPFWEH